MERLTINTSKGPALRMDNPRNEEEARKMLMDKYLEAVKKLAQYEDIGFTPEELNLFFDPPEQIYIIDFPEDDDETDETLIVRKLNIETESMDYYEDEHEILTPYWKCTDEYVGDYTVRVAGLGEKYWLIREEAEMELERRKKMKIVENYIDASRHRILSKQENEELKEGIAGLCDLCTHRLTLDKAKAEGQKEAWKLAQRIVKLPFEGGMKASELRDIFGSAASKDVFYQSYDEVVEKVAAWEKAKDEIHVGDVIDHQGLKSLVVRVEPGTISTVTSFGTTPKYTDEAMKQLKKTGQNLPVKDWLAQIGGKEE